MRNTPYGRVLTAQDVLDFIKSPVGTIICCVIATLMAFSAGVKYARNTAELVYSNEDFCSLRIGSVQKTYWEKDVYVPPFP